MYQVGMAVPTSTTNITGFLTCTRGSSFLKESGMAARMIFSLPDTFFVIEKCI